MRAKSMEGKRGEGDTGDIKEQIEEVL